MRHVAVIFASVLLTITGSSIAQAAPVGLSGVWRVVSIDGAPPPGRAGVTLNFEPGGRLSGQAPCNRYHAGYRIEADRIIFSSGALTRMFCGEEIMRAEQRFMEILGGGADWRLSGDALTLTTDSGAKVTATRARAR
jgi:heat shock protein HslJ